MTQTVADTGASAGVGRAAARLFGQRGDRVALIARGRAGLGGAVRDVGRAGRTALVVPADVADFDQVETAAKWTSPWAATTARTGSSTAGHTRGARSS